MGPVAAGDIVRLAAFFRTVRTAQPRQGSSALVAVTEKFGLPLDRDAHRCQPVDQQLLVLVLREDVQERIARQLGADLCKRDPRLVASPDPQVDRRHLVAPFDDGIGQIELAIELERASVDGQCARRGPRCGGLVDDARLDA